MAKIRTSVCFAGVLDGEHQARAFLQGACYELADDGLTPPGAVPGSLLAVVLSEKWGEITLKGTPAEPDFLHSASPQVQREMVDAASADAAAKVIETADAAEAEAIRLAEDAAKAKAKADTDVLADASAQATQDAKDKAAAEAKAAAKLKAAG